MTLATMFLAWALAGLSASTTPISSTDATRTSAPSWCDDAAATLAVERRAVALPADVRADGHARESFQRYAHLIAMLTESHPPLMEDVRRVAGDDGKLENAFLTLSRIVEQMCGSDVDMSADAARSMVTNILRDDVFTGERAKGDIVDRWIEKLQAWFLSFLESEGMQRYAGISRALYLSVVVAVALWLSLRVLRERRRRKKAAASPPQSRGATARSRQRARELLDAARVRDARGATRDALLLVERALFAAVQEQTDVAAGITRTHADVLSALDASTRTRFAPVFAACSDAVFGGAAISVGDLVVRVESVLHDDAMFVPAKTPAADAAPSTTTEPERA